MFHVPELPVLVRIEDLFRDFRNRVQPQALSIQLKTPELSKWGQMTRKFLWKVSEIAENCSISKKRTIKPKILEMQEENQMEWKVVVRNLRKFEYNW